jgi:hypothetical protein
MDPSNERSAADFQSFAAALADVARRSSVSSAFWLTGLAQATLQRRAAASRHRLMISAPDAGMRVVTLS